MKNTTLLLSILLASASVFADEATDNKNLTLAAADANIKTSWVETEEDIQVRLNDTLAEKTDALNAKINAKLEKQLEEKLSKEFRN